MRPKDELLTRLANLLDEKDAEIKALQGENAKLHSVAKIREEHIQRLHSTHTERKNELLAQNNQLESKIKALEHQIAEFQKQSDSDELDKAYYDIRLLARMNEDLRRQIDNLEIGKERLRKQVRETAAVQTEIAIKTKIVYVGDPADNSGNQYEVERVILDNAAKGWALASMAQILKNNVYDSEMLVFQRRVPVEAAE